MADLGKLKIDLSMDKTINAYPLSSLPLKQNTRSGKAKLSLFEQIDSNLYKEHAKIITFYTNLDRIQPWIKTLDIYYYDNLGKELNMILNGTIRVQDSHYSEFVDVHFPILKDILDKVLENISQTSSASISHDCHDENNNTHINELCHNKVPCVLPDSQIGLKTVLVQEDQPQKDDFQRFESNLVHTLAKTEHSHNENFSKILTAVKQCYNDILGLGKCRKLKMKMRCNWNIKPYRKTDFGS
ncbi:unnamed protein product [Mytilus coruscus]|uniref:Uncharacterized protein n=1 Tax=Mytilus coruscus TaxID=42192 RepID=A0A6J8DWN6_MYTCO|nr:unnamed protein product [Mytilus coruscus]